MKIFLVFKTHFDIGFTDLSEKIIDQYAGKMLEQVIETCDSTANLGKLKYVWTMPSWPLKIMQKAEPKLRKALDRLIKNRQIAWHALPFTSHFDFSGIEDAIQGLQYAKELSDEYNLPLPISAKMTDVPGHGRLLPTILASAGIKFLHLGCNEFATPPKVPPIFFWEGPDGSRVLTMYGAGGYGSSITPSEGWGFPVWMSLMHTHDNCGPQTAGMLHSIVEEVRKHCPDAEIECGTMDDFYNEISLCDLSHLPIVKGDLADTWIHGVGSYPAEAGLVRKTRKTIAAANAASVLFDKDISAETRSANDNIILFDEHTWGLDVKTNMLPNRLYDKQNFQNAKKSAEYKRMESSWDEQRRRAENAAISAQSALEKVGSNGCTVVNPNGTEFSGWVKTNSDRGISICGKNQVYVSNVPVLSARNMPDHEKFGTQLELVNGIIENHRYRISIDNTRGIITELFDKKIGCPLLCERDGVGVFSYHYDKYGSEDMTEYLRDYAYRFSDWGIRDNGRDNYPECKYERFEPQFESLTVENFTVSLNYRGSGYLSYGDGEKITILITLPPEGEELFVRVIMDNKAETPYVESGSLALPMAMDNPNWWFNKNGDIINPETDIVDCANHALYCLEAFACADDGFGGICAVSHDAPLCAIGETGIYAYRKQYEKHSPILYFNLFNNMWGTNFPQWIGGDFSWEFTLFGYKNFCNSKVYDRALSLYQGAYTVCASPRDSEIILPDKVQVLLCARQSDGSIVLHIRDTSLQSRHLMVCADGFIIMKIDTRGTPNGSKEKNSLSFDLPAFGIAAFKLVKERK